VACDGHGSYRACTVTAAAGGGRRSGRSVALEPTGDRQRAERASPAVTVGFSLAKGDRTEWAVAKLVELGVDRVVPMLCARTIARPSDTDDRRLERLWRIARESAMQARIVYLPEVAQVVEAASLTGEGVALAEPGGGPPSLATPTILVGPEGGWSESELSWGLPKVGLGDTILRIETAAVAAGNLLTSLRAGVVGAVEQ
jgi:16S rRNA (uracil1498-N3)-methyltransferase